MESRNGKHFSSFAAADQPAEDNEVLKTSVEMIPMKSTVSSKKDSNKKKPGSKPAKKGFSNILSTILLIVGIALLIAAAIMFGKTQVDYYAQDVINQELAAYTTVPWIQIPGSQINYPVYQTTDNEYYLHTNAKGEWSIGGQIFMDYENNPNGLIDQQTILYGHHMRNGSMFQFIGALNDQSTFNKVETIWYVTPTQTYELEPVFTYHTDEDDDEVRQFNFTSVDEFRSYLKDRLSRAVSSRSDAAEVISRAEHVLTLFTCNYTDQYGRTMLICVPKSEARPKTQ